MKGYQILAVVGSAVVSALAYAVVVKWKEVSRLFWKGLFRLKDWWNRPSEIEEDEAEILRLNALSKDYEDKNSKLRDGKPN